MVGGLGLATGGLQGAGGQQLLAVGAVSRVRRDGVHHLGQIQRVRVHRVVHAGVGDVAVHVQALGDAHAAGGADALGGGGGHEGRGVEGHGRRHLAALLLHGGHSRTHGAFHAGHGGRSLGLGLEAGRGMGRLEGLGAVAGGGAGRRATVEGTADDPVVLGHKRHALALALDDDGERRRLHAPGGAHVAVAGELHQREVAREHRAPNEVDVAARPAGGGQVVVHGHEVGEGVGDLRLREGGVARPRHRRRGVHLAAARQRVGADELALAVEVGGDDDGVGLLRQVLQRADDVLLLGQLLDGRVDEIRQRLHLPPLELHAVGGEGLLLFEGGLGKAVRHDSGQHLALGGDALPAATFLVGKARGEIGLQDVAAQADGHPLLPLDFESVDRRVEHLVGFGLGSAQKIGDLHRRVVLLRNDQFHGTILLLGRMMRPSRSHDLPHLEIFTCAGFVWAAAPPWGRANAWGLGYTICREAVRESR